jgi:hypothetical protein
LEEFLPMYLAIVYFGEPFDSKEVAIIFGLRNVSVLTIMVWATFWAIA